MNKEYTEKAKFIWQNFVPKNGQAEFEQGELLRAIEKLRDESQRNANANFNEKCHGILKAFLGEKLIDHKIFDNQSIAQIKADLAQLGTKDHPYLDDDIYDRLTERIIEWCDFHQEPVPHAYNSELGC